MVVCPPTPLRQLGHTCPHCIQLLPTPLRSCCDCMGQAGVGHSMDIVPKASCGTQLTGTSGAESKRWRMSWETKKEGLKQRLEKCGEGCEKRGPKAEEQTRRLRKVEREERVAWTAMLKRMLRLQRHKPSFSFRNCLLLLPAVLSTAVATFQGRFTHTFLWHYLLLPPDPDALETVINAGR